MMSLSLRRWAGVDLAGRLSDWIRRYRSNRLNWFDHRSVRCFVSACGPNRFQVYAKANCSDFRVTETNTDVVTVYRSRPRFRSLIEAYAHLEAEVRSAAAVHPDTNFYRDRAMPVLEDGRVRNDINVQEVYSNGAWIPVDSLPSGRWCRACGSHTGGILCPNCGEPVVG